MNRNYIYALIDPRDMLVYYIGKTLNPRTRYYDHCNRTIDRSRNYRYNSVNPKRLWIGSLLLEGLVPIMVILDFIDTNDLRKVLDMELAYTQLAADMGMPLTNNEAATQCRYISPYTGEVDDGRMYNTHIEWTLDKLNPYSLPKEYVNDWVMVEVERYINDIFRYTPQLEASGAPVPTDHCSELAYYALQRVLPDNIDWNSDVRWFTPDHDTFREIINDGRIRKVTNDA